MTVCIGVPYKSSSSWGKAVPQSADGGFFTPVFLSFGASRENKLLRGWNLSPVTCFLGHRWALGRLLALACVPSDAIPSGRLLVSDKTRSDVLSCRLLCATEILHATSTGGDKRGNIMDLLSDCMEKHLFFFVN